jgi:hypothetical protein
MGHQIIKQPDGKLCVFSTVVDAIVIEDATEQDLLDYYVAQAAAKERDRVKKIIRNVQLGNPEDSYYQFTMSYEEAVEIDREREAGELDGD